ncbi:DUF6542 domain-containing protein [Streptomyces sp. NEAU-Y11]|uniref:DUF6542 domain-containing protein n=1 Tax=Streptomyces cucumeris TaxID=2962890 RepID=UPI0020C8D223|nr:DUF6542 domain-containing protein [Streptomyces sp. NEAU-Y11]MCP9206157.1 hypothetical protein [Streptomyces sp. NEAU-Y11]
MEHYSTRTPRRTAAPPPRPAADDTYTGRGGRGPGRSGADRVSRPARAPARRTRPLGAAAGALAGLRGRGLSWPNPRLTGLGTGLLTTGAMLGFGCLDALLFSGSPAVYSGFFLFACVACAMWVRPADLLAGPVTVPLAFTAGLLPINDGGDGFGAQAVGVFTVLSLHAGWLYSGTLLTVLIVLVRRATLVSQRRRQRPTRTTRPSRPPRSPHCSGAGQARSRP